MFVKDNFLDIKCQFVIRLMKYQTQFKAVCGFNYNLDFMYNIYGHNSN